MFVQVEVRGKDLWIGFVGSQGRPKELLQLCGSDRKNDPVTDLGLRAGGLHQLAELAQIQKD
jgi:hypothetical protein